MQSTKERALCVATQPCVLGMCAALQLGMRINPSLNSL